MDDVNSAYAARALNPLSAAYNITARFDLKVNLYLTDLPHSYILVINSPACFGLC